MSKEDRPLLTDEFLDEVVREINQQFGAPLNEQNVDFIENIPPTN